MGTVVYMCHMEVSINGGTPKWMVYLMENPNLKWIMYDMMYDLSYVSYTSRMVPPLLSLAFS